MHYIMTLLCLNPLVISHSVPFRVEPMSTLPMWFPRPCVTWKPTSLPTSLSPSYTSSLPHLLHIVQVVFLIPESPTLALGAFVLPVPSLPTFILRSLSSNRSCSLKLPITSVPSSSFCYTTYHYLKLVNVYLCPV